MTLEEISQSRKTIPFPRIGSDPELSLEIQGLLYELGILDGPPDGQFGPVSVWALGAFAARALVIRSESNLTSDVAKALLDRTAPATFALKPGDDFAGRTVRAMLDRGDWICRHPDCVNIVYVDGTETDGRPNDNSHNKFHDVRLVIRVAANGTPAVVGAWEATTEPGEYYVRTKKLDLRGAAHIVAGQYKAWSVGTHRANSPSAHEALVQTLPVRVSRDFDENFDPTGDKEFVGLFGINQHWGYDFSREDVRTASAGCLVGRARAGHREFMALCKSDPRYKANHAYRFMTAVLSSDSLGRVRT